VIDGRDPEENLWLDLFKEAQESSQDELVFRVPNEKVANG
jgi:hypothetical protein